MKRRVPTVKGFPPVVAPWCHHCDLPLDEAHTLRSPDDPIGGSDVVVLVCSRCLRGPEGLKR